MDIPANATTAPTLLTDPARYAVYCRVVDNYGDAGVCWRLSQLLAHAHGRTVTLWIDDGAALAAFVPGVDAAAALQVVDGVTICALGSPSTPAGHDADVVIEAFGCGLPDSCLDAMETRRHVWINLEYLSAESWVDSRHGLPSPQPSRPLTRWFFFPGFTAATGGLLREPGLLAQRAAWRTRAPLPNAARIGMFCYENAALPALFDAWASGGEPIHVTVPERVATRSIARWLGEALAPGARVRRGSLVLENLAWVSQNRFDERLWDADLNIVRGEDSFVRAQWAARPLVWHIYPQDAAAHRPKLAAFLDRYLVDVASPVAHAVTAFWDAFDRQDGIAATAAWPVLWAHRRALESHAVAWAARLAFLPELSAALVEFAKKRYN